MAVADRHDCRFLSASTVPRLTKWHWATSTLVQMVIRRTAELDRWQRLWLGPTRHPAKVLRDRTRRSAPSKPKEKEL